MKLVKRVGRRKATRTGSKRRVSMNESESHSSTRWRGDSLSSARSLRSLRSIPSIRSKATSRGLSFDEEEDDDYKGYNSFDDPNEDQIHGFGYGLEDDHDDDDEEEEDDEADDESIDLSHDDDFEETELFDVRFRSLRTRFQYLIDDETDDSDEDSE